MNVIGNIPARLFCVVCNAEAGTCDCFTRCGCGWTFRTGERCTRVDQEVEIDLHAVSESNARGHWSKRKKRAGQQRGVTRLVIASRRALRGDILDTHPLLVTFTRLAPSKGLDDDNLRGALKAVRDGMADALGIDDADPRVTWEYGQERRKTYAVRIRIEERGR